MSQFAQSDVPPSYSSGMSQPNGTAAGAQDSLVNAKNTAVNTAQSTMSSIQNSDTVQSLSNGPVAQNVKSEASKTQSEFQNVANSRTTPSKPAATGQPLTHYHSMFYNILSWQNPRASGFTFASIVALIFAARYLNVLHYFFKTGFMILGTTAALELAGKTILDSGFASRFRPKRYYTIPREALENSLEDFEQLINFFVIEFQRILFAENVPYTLAASAAALVSWGLIKVVPFWGLALISTCVVFLTPLIYVSNKETIDNVLEQSSAAMNQQMSQVRDLTAHHTNRATSSVKSYAGEYTSKAQDMMARKSGSPLGPSSQATASSQEHTLKPSSVAGTSDPSHLPTPPSAEPRATNSSTEAPAVPKTEPGTAMPSI